MSFPVWIQVITQIVTAFTAVVMAVLAYRTYLRAPEQEETEPENASDNQAEDILREVLVFRTR